VDSVSNEIVSIKMSDGTEVTGKDVIVKAAAAKKRQLDTQRLQILKQISPRNGEYAAKEIVSITLSDGTVITGKEEIVKTLAGLVSEYKENQELCMMKNVFVRYVGTKIKKSQDMQDKRIATIDDAEKLLEEIKGRTNSRSTEPNEDAGGVSRPLSHMQAYRDMFNKTSDGEGNGAEAMDKQDGGGGGTHYKNGFKPRRPLREKYELPMSGVSGFLQYVKNQRGFPRRSVEEIVKARSSRSAAAAQKDNSDSTQDIDCIPCTDYMTYLLQQMPYWKKQMGIEEAGELALDAVPVIGREYVDKMLVAARHPFAPCRFANMCVANSYFPTNVNLMAFVMPEEYETIMATGLPLRGDTRSFCLMCLLMLGTLAWFHNSEESHANTPIRFPFSFKMNCPDGYVGRTFIQPPAGFTDGVGVPFRKFCASDFVPCKRKTVLPELVDGCVTKRSVCVTGFRESDKIFFVERACTTWTETQAQSAPRMFTSSRLINTNTEYFLSNFISTPSCIDNVKEKLLGGSLAGACKAAGHSVESVVRCAFVEFSDLRAAVKDMLLIDNPLHMSALLSTSPPITAFLYLYRDFRPYVDLHLPPSTVASYATHSAFFATLVRANAASELLELTRGVYLDAVRRSVAAGKRNKKVKSITEGVERSMQSMGRSVDAKLVAFVEAHYVLLQWFQTRIDAGEDFSDAALLTHPDWDGFLKPCAPPAFQPMDLRRNTPQSLLYAKPCPASICVSLLRADVWGLLSRWSSGCALVEGVSGLEQLVFCDFLAGLRALAAVPAHTKQRVVSEPGKHFCYWCPREVVQALDGCDTACDVALLLLVRVNETMGLLEVWGEELVNVQRELARSCDNVAQLDECVVSACGLDEVMRAEVELLYSQHLSHKRALASSRSRNRKNDGSERGDRAARQDPQPSKLQRQHGLESKLAHLERACYELRMHAHTHLSLALVALSADNVSDAWFCNTCVDTEPSPLMAHYPALYGFSGEEDMLDISHDVTNIKFVLENQHRGEFLDLLRKTLPGVCYGRDFLKKLVMLLKKQPAHAEWVFSCLRTSMMGGYRSCRRWPGFGDTLRVWAWTESWRDPEVLIAFLSREDNINLVMNTLREQTVYAVERNAAFDIKLGDSFSGWSHFKQKVGAIMDTVRAFYRRHHSFEGVNALIAATFESDPKKDVFRSNMGTFRAYILRRFRVLHSYAKYSDESARNNEAVPMDVRREYFLDDTTRDLIDHYVACMTPGGTIQMCGLIPIGLSVDGAQKLISMMRMFHNREPDVEINKVAYTLGKRDYEILQYFFDALDLHFSVTAIPVPKHIAHAQEMAVRTRYELDIHEPSTPPMKTIALIPSHGRVVSHTSESGFGSIGNVRVFFDLQRGCHFQDKKETVSKSKPKTGSLKVCAADHVDEEIITAHAEPEPEPEPVPVTASRQKLNKKYLKTCARTPVDLIYIKDHIVQFTPGQASYTRCPKCGHIFQFSISKYGINGLSCGVCDHFQQALFKTPYCHSCLRSPKQGYRLVTWMAVDDQNGTFDIVCVNTCVDCTKNIKPGSRDRGYVLTSAILGQENRCSTLDLLRSRAGKQFASMPHRGGPRIKA